MHCDCTEKVSLLIDGELSPVEAREVERHLLTCTECQEARGDFLNLRNQFASVPVSFRPVAQREALARILGKPPSVSRGFTRRWLFNPAVAAVASLLIVAGLIALLLYPRSKPGPAESGEIASGPSRKPTPAPAPSRSAEGGQKDRVVPKGSQPPGSNDKNKAPKKKIPPVIVEPPEDNIAAVVPETRVRAADTETMTAIHFQKSELLLRSFRNVRTSSPGVSAEIGYEKRLAQQLVYQNMMLRREADAAGDAQVASLLESLEPILLDIANLPAKPAHNEVKVIKDRVERKNIVALLQVNSTALARALD
ncbi:MAG TPA: zf-HC2 domain-containing protein [Pyrinomonadaceae bacterium]